MTYPTIAAQMYTVREFTKTPENIRESLEKIKKIGYPAVQVSGIGKIEYQELKDMVDEIGLEICATHIPYDRLVNDMDEVIRQHKLWNCKYVGIGSMPGQYKSDKEGYITFAREASKYAKILADQGLRFIYHNHSFEYVKFDGVTGMDILLQESDPDFHFEIDTYWVQYGGADPIEWINKVKGRMDVVHYKDMVISSEKNQRMAEVGEGNLNWKGIIEACKANGVKFAAVEQDVCPTNPFDCLETSFNNLKKMGL